MSSPPRISIVTPSYNQHKFLEETICSVLDQKYPNVEYVVMDGGSTDGSVEIIRKYADRLSYWQSKKDGGQYAAINAGFAHTTGEVMGWINSDDKHLPWTLEIVGEVFASRPEVEWITTAFPISWDIQGRAVKCDAPEICTKETFFRGRSIPGDAGFSTMWIQQESTFWRRSLWEKAGAGLDESISLAGDFELWARFYQHADMYSLRAPLAGFRIHGDQRSLLQFEEYYAQARSVLHRHGGRVDRRRRLPGLGRLMRMLPWSARQRWGAARTECSVWHGGPGKGWQVEKKLVND